jgi:hypothetical protein
MLITEVQTGLVGEHKTFFPSTSFPSDGPTNAWLSKKGYVLTDKTEGELSYAVRVSRNELLEDTDKMALTDRTLSPQWATYRQELRDITNQEGFPYSVTFPTKPE